MENLVNKVLLTEYQHLNYWEVLFGICFLLEQIDFVWLEQAEFINEFLPTGNWLVPLLPGQLLIVLVHVFLLDVGD